jgi:hypothetical protein
MNEHKGCPGCGEYEDCDCRCTGEDYDRFTWKPGDVEVKPAGFEWKIPFDSADYLEGGIEYEPKNKLQALILARSEPIRCTCTDKRDLGCPKHGVVIIRFSENSIFDFAADDRPPPRYRDDEARTR